MSTEQIDPQVTSSIITAGTGLIGTLIGAVAGFWRGGRRGAAVVEQQMAAQDQVRSAQDQRCERICASMVGMNETMLAVMRALGLDDPRVTPHIARLETYMAEARAYLNETGV